MAKLYKYKIVFEDGTHYETNSFSMASAVILAQAEQIKQEKNFTQIERVHEYKTNIDYKPVYHFSAHPTVNEIRAINEN